MPGGWHTAAPKANFTVTLFLFAWALLPIGFMGMMLLFHKFETFRLPIMALSDTLLVITLVSAISQRKGSVYDAKIQLSGFLLGISILLSFTSPTPRFPFFNFFFNLINFSIFFFDY